MVRGFIVVDGEVAALRGMDPKAPALEFIRPDAEEGAEVVPDVGDGVVGGHIHEERDGVGGEAGAELDGVGDLLELLAWHYRRALRVQRFLRKAFHSDLQPSAGSAVVKEKRRQREREVINIILNKFGSPRGQCVLDRNRTQAHTRKSTDGAGGERRGAKNVLL